MVIAALLVDAKSLMNVRQVVRTSASTQAGVTGKDEAGLALSSGTPGPVPCMYPRRRDVFVVSRHRGARARLRFRAVVCFHVSFAPLQFRRERFTAKFSSLLPSLVVGTTERCLGMIGGVGGRIYGSVAGGHLTSLRRTWRRGYFRSHP